MTIRCRIVPFGLAFLVCGALGASLRAAVEVPPEACGDQVIAVAVFDAQACTPQALAAGAKVLLGDAATKLVGEPLKQFEVRYGKLTPAGVTALAVALPWRDGDADKKGGPGAPLLFLKLKDKAGAEAAKAAVAEIVGATGKPGSPAVVLTGDGDWIGVTFGGQPALQAGSEARQKLVKDLLGKTGDAAIKAVLIPNKAMKEQVMASAASTGPRGKRPDFMGLPVAFGKVDSATAGVTLSPKPALSLAINLADANAAKTILTEWDRFLKVTKDMSLQAAADTGDPNPTAVMVDVAKSALVFKTEGAAVLLTLDDQRIAELGQGFVAARKAADEMAKRMLTRAYMRLLHVAIARYANDHQGQLPPTLDDLKGKYVRDETWERYMTNEKTGLKNGYVYARPAETLSEVRDMAKTGMIWEADKDGKPLKGGYVCYMDGHVAFEK